MRRPIRAAAGLATATVMSLVVSGCMTVHGELAVLPGAKKSEAAQALADFTEAYNKADKAYDPELDAGRVTGALGAINQAGLKARSVTNPEGNAQHQPLELTDAKYLIPRKAGWPRWFVADTDSNRDKDDGPGDNRWVLVFVRGGADQLWEVAYLAILSPDEIPEFKTDKDGYVVPAPADSGSPAVAPGEVGGEYVSYLKDGKPEHFARGPHTDQWRSSREKNAKLPGLTIQYSDQRLDDGEFAPLALATKDGGAFVFFAIKYFERQTAAAGYTPKVSADVKALLTGRVENTLTKEWVSSQAALLAPDGADADQIKVLSRLQGVIGAEGS
ncbi:hypothetical protein [Streptomyces niveus]